MVSMSQYPSHADDAHLLLFNLTTMLNIGKDGRPSAGKSGNMTGSKTGNERTQ